MSGHEDADDARRRYQAPYTAKHPIPTIGKYREEKQARKAEAASEGDDEGPTRTERAKEGWRSYWNGEGKEDDGEQTQQNGGAKQDGGDVDGDGDVDQDDEDEAQAVVDTSEATPITNPKKQKKGKGNKEERAEREVTDPITHLPVKIYDFTTDALKDVEENPPPFGSTTRTATGLSNKNKSGRDLHNEVEEMQDGQDSMISLFPPPNYDVIRRDLISKFPQGQNHSIPASLEGTRLMIRAMAA